MGGVTEKNPVFLHSSNLSSSQMLGLRGEPGDLAGSGFGELPTGVQTYQQPTGAWGARDSIQVRNCLWGSPEEHRQRPVPGPEPTFLLARHHPGLFSCIQNCCIMMTQLRFKLYDVRANTDDVTKTSTAF